MFLGAREALRSFPLFLLKAVVVAGADAVPFVVFLTALLLPGTDGTAEPAAALKGDPRDIGVMI